MGLPVRPVKLLAANIGPNQPLPANGQIELQFDRLLQPISITRQTFQLQDIGQATAFTPTVAYDPVARIVTISPLADADQALKPQQSYQLVITSPMNDADPNGLRAIDGAPLESPATRVIAFNVTDPIATPPSTVSIDFCRDIEPIVGTKCAFPTCHLSGVASGAAGLVLDPPSYIASTAIGRVSQAANTGPRAAAASPSLLFGEDMPIVDATGNPSQSWLLYKLLLATPSPAVVSSAEAGAGDAGTADATVTTADAGETDAGGEDGEGGEAGAEAGREDAAVGDAGTDAGRRAPVPVPVIPPVSVAHVHDFTFDPISTDDQAVLAQYILGRQMPYPGFANPLTLDELERMSLWIAQGASVPATCR